MGIRKTEAVIWIVVLLIACMAAPVWAQSSKEKVKAASQSSGSVSAEMVKGKLSPSSSKPGDKIAVRLKEDVRSNGEVVLKKGTTINGVVKSVKQADSKAKGGAQSMMEIEWLAPVASGGAAQNLNIALQSLSYTNPLYAHQQNEEAATLDAGLPAPRPVQQSSGTSSRQGGLLGGIGGSTASAISSATSSVTSIGGTRSGVIGGVGATRAGVAGTAGTVDLTAGRKAGTSVMSADPGVASGLHDSFGVSSERLYMTGHGQVISAGGSRESIDLFSHLTNDTVIVSPARNFEVSSGAQMQLLIGVKGR